MLRSAGFSQEMGGNKIALFSNADNVAALQGASGGNGNGFVEALRSTVTWGLTRHEGSDISAGGMQLGKSEFIISTIENLIDRSKLPSNHPQYISANAVKYGIFQLHQYISAVARGEVKGADGKPIGVMGGLEFKGVLASKYNPPDAALYDDPAKRNLRSTLDTYFARFDKNEISNDRFRVKATIDLYTATRSFSLLNADEAKAISKVFGEGNVAKVNAAIIMIGTLAAETARIFPGTAETVAQFFAAIRDPETMAEFQKFLKDETARLDYLAVIKEVYKRTLELISRDGHTAALRTLQVISEKAGITGGGLANPALYLDITYEAIKKGAETGDWTDLINTTVKYGATNIGVAVVVAASIAVAAKLNPVLGSVVAAGWSSLGYKAVIDGGVDLIKKITSDLVPVIVNSGLVTEAEGHQGSLEKIADRILTSAGVGKVVPPTIGPFNGTYVIDDQDPLYPAEVHGGKEQKLFFGRNGAIIHGGGGDDEIHATGYGEVYGDDGNDRILVYDTEGIIVDGGAGDDIILSKDGKDGTFEGGAGRDWIFAKTRGSEIYGDTSNGTYQKPLLDGDSQPVLDENGDPKSETVAILDSPENSDNFWYWPGTTIMDAGHYDVLKFFGVPLTGGNAGGSAIFTAAFLGHPVAAFGIAAFNSAIDPNTGQYDPTRGLFYGECYLEIDRLALGKNSDGRSSGIGIGGDVPIFLAHDHHHA